MSLDNIKLQGDKVLIQLFPFEEMTTTDSGLKVIKVGIQQSESGKAKAVIDDRYKYQDRGEVVAIGPRALTLMQETHPDVTIGSTVWISHAANSPNFQFLTDRTQPVQDFKGLVAIFPGSIEAVEASKALQQD